jgi:hypothetical protein
VTEVLLVAALAAAIATFARRRWRRAKLRRLAETRPGASPALAIPIAGFDEIDDHLRSRRCACGGYLARCGEGSRERAGHRYRVARLECLDCARVEEVFFDTTDLRH